MDREELMKELEELFQDEPDNNKLNAVLDLADAYAEYEYEERKKSEKVQWGKDVCAAAGEDVDEFPEQKGQMYWYETWRDLRIVTKAPKEKKKLTKEELAKKEQDRKSKEVKEILKGSAARRKDFISGIISGKIPALKDENAAREKIWEALVLIGYGLYGSIARGFFLEDDEWKYSEEERKQATETFQGLSITHQMLVFLHGSMNTVGETYDYSGRYAKEKADKLLKGYEALKLFGWFFEMDEEKRVLDGTSELFAPAEEK